MERFLVRSPWRYLALGLLAALTASPVLGTSAASAPEDRPADPARPDAPPPPAELTETIAMIGTGNVGATLGRLWAARGHTILYGSRTPDDDRVRALVAETGNGATAMSQAEAAARADIVVIPIPPGAIPQVMAELGDLTGKIVIDPTNLVGFEDGFTTAPRDPRLSLAREVQELAPGAHVVKALNTLNYTIMEDPSRAGGPVTVPIAGDDPEAKARVARLVEELGLEPLDVGPLAAAQYLEEMLRLYVGFRTINPGIAFEYHLRIRPN